MKGALRLGQRAQNLGLLREATLLLLGEDERAVGDDVVLALCPFDRLGLEALLVQLSRETRGSFVVPASDRAVEDLDAHAPHRNARRQGRRSKYQPSSAS
jgi:hypothetical protein